MVVFRSTTGFEREIIYKLLCESYAGLLESKLRFADEYTLACKRLWEATNSKGAVNIQV